VTSKFFPFSLDQVVCGVQTSTQKSFVSFFRLSTINNTTVLEISYDKILVLKTKCFY